MSAPAFLGLSKAGAFLLPGSVSQLNRASARFNNTLMAQICGRPPPAISVVVPVRNEAGNIAPLVGEIVRALGGRSFEVVYVNDGSDDATEVQLRELMCQHAQLRQIRQMRGGQSAAVRTGVTMARAPIVVTLDGDGQNDPAFIPTLVARLEEGSPRLGLVAGQRIRRQASRFKQLQSHVANGLRSLVLDDQARDSACGLKAFRRELFLALPYFEGLHRFLPALVRLAGYEVAYIDVVDRPRRRGSSKYGLNDRLWIGIVDLAGVWWLTRRTKAMPQAEEVTLAH
jgi:dolichol-phosphate mannosyltransferase